MVGHGSKFGKKKEAAIVALLSHRNVEEAARSVGIATPTLYRWMKDPEFDAAYRQAKRAAFGQAIARLQQGSAAAATTMLKIMLDGSTSAATRLRAADCIFKHTKGALELEQIEDRIAILEQSVSRPNGASDRSEVRKTTSLDDLSDEELQALLASAESKR